MERLTKPFRVQSSEQRKPISEEQKRKRARFVVYPLMFLLCLGSFYLIFSPSEEERKLQQEGLGFNTEVPSPRNNSLEGNKKEAYEKAQMEQENKKRKTFFETEQFILGREQRNDSVHLPLNMPQKFQESMQTGNEDGPVGSSAGAYREMNRTLGSIYEPRTDPEKERLQERIEELERMQQTQKQESLSGMEEKMALMEKSYELAARYNNPQAVETPSPVRKAEDKKVMPVKQVHHEVVSSLSRPMSNEEFTATFTGERNTGFHTAVGRKTLTQGNTIEACVHGTQTVSDGQALRLRLTEPMSVADRLIPKGTVLVGVTRIQGERLGIMLNAIEYKGTILPVELEVYDLDGQQGISVPGSLEHDAAREIAANMGSSMNSSINISANAGAQIASDVGKGVIQGISQYISKRMRTPKITLKAGHRVLLHSPEN